METIGVIDNVLEKRVGKTIYYLGTITSDKLRELTFVPVIEASSKTFLNEETEDGYQRPGSQSRMRRFKNFLKENPGIAAEIEAGIRAEVFPKAEAEAEAEADMVEAEA